MKTKSKLKNKNMSHLFLKWMTVGLLMIIGSTSAAVEPTGWYAGDMHVHRSCGGSPIAISSMYQKLLPQNLAFISLLADNGNGEVQDPVQDLPRVTGQDDPISTPGHIVHWDAEWHWDATYNQYPHQALGGHVVALGLINAQQIWEEYTYPIFKWAHQQNGIAGFAHMQYLDDNIPQSLNCCIPIEYPVEIALGSADFIDEDVTDVNTSISGMNPEAAIHAYYRLLNDGFRPGLAAGTDYPCGNNNVGSLLTYVKVKGPSYKDWIDGIAKGRTIVSRNGHNEFLNLTVNTNTTPGDEINLTGTGSVPVTIIWTANQSLSGTIELVNNGVVVASKQASVTSGSPANLSTTVNFDKSGWLAARRMGTNGHYVHTGAVFVTVNNKPVRVSVTDAQFYVQWMDNLLQKTSPGGVWNSYFVNNLSDAQARYQSAKSIYQQIALEAGQQVTGQQECCSIWPASATPGTITENDASAVELGVKFLSDVNGNITGIRFYKGPSNTGTHVGSLWSRTGTLLGQATFSGETATGWQQVNFTTPIRINANTTYVASYHTNVGFYSEDDNYFASSGVDNPPLHALKNGVDGNNGVYVYNANPAFPSNGYLSSNYWVDAVFHNSSIQDTTVCPCSIWAPSAIPGMITDSDTSAVELGVKFRSDVNGNITGIRFYKGPTNTGTHVGSLWSRTGILLGRVTFSGETASGWQQANFVSPINVTAGTTYIVSYHTNVGHYPDDANFFASSGVDNPPLHALKNGIDGSNGVYVYNVNPAFPSNTWSSSNYWVDVVFTTSIP